LLHNHVLDSKHQTMFLLSFVFSLLKVLYCKCATS